MQEAEIGQWDLSCVDSWAGKALGIARGEGRQRTEGSALRAATMMKPGRSWALMRQCTLMLLLLGAAVPLVTMASAATMPSPAPADGRRRASVTAAVHVAGLPCQSAVCRLRGGQGDGDSMAGTPGRARSTSPPRSASPPRPKAADVKAAKGSKLKPPGGAEAPAVRIASVQSRTRMYASPLLCATVRECAGRRWICIFLP